MKARRTEGPILLIGAGGQVGRALAPRLARLAPVVCARRVDADLEQAAEVRALVRRVQPRLVVNAAAYTAVDAAERDVERCQRSNATAPAVLAEETARVGAPLVHYSTNYVFDGQRPDPYPEEAVPSPLSVYGATKLAGEREVSRRNPRHLILRTAGVYDRTGPNFVQRMLELAHAQAELRIVDDQLISPTPAWLLAEATASAIRHLDKDEVPGWGTYHLTTAGCTSWYAFAQRILALDPERASQRVKSVVAISTAEHPTPARRPLNGVLAIERFERAFGLRLSHWEEALRRTFGGEETCT